MPEDAGVRGAQYRSPEEVGASAAACALSALGVVLVVGVAAIARWAS